MNCKRESNRRKQLPVDSLFHHYYYPSLLMRLSVIVTLAAILLASPDSMAQSNASSFDKFRKEKKSEFERYRKEKKTEFERFRKQLNEEYAALLGASWKVYKEHPSKEPPMRPKPIHPVAADNGTPPKVQFVPISTVIEPERPIPDIPVTLPQVTPNRKKTYPINFSFFNTPCGIGKFDTSVLSISKTDNASLRTTWSRLTASEAMEPLIDDCLRLREELQLCDWGYLLLVKKIAEVLYPHSTNCQAFLTVALLNQSGYDSRIGIRGNRLAVMFHASHQLYATSYHIINGKNYYLLGPQTDTKEKLYSYDGDYRHNPTPIRMTIDRFPRFAPPQSTVKTYSSAAWKAAPPFEITVNPSLIAFLDTYPQVDWPIYGLAPVSEELRTTLFPVMKLLTEGLDELKAVNLLLNFNNYAFNYMTDGDQFGREKPFFFDENFYYPYNDCEDRAILFAKLVNSVLGLDVVYLKYPRHLATAVRFSPNSGVTGATVTVDGKVYHVCDPTCIGAQAGYLAGAYLNAKPTVYKIKP